MPVLREWNLELTADKVMWGQGADPAIIRARRPRLVELAERVIEEGLPLLEPAVSYTRYPVRELRHERLLLGPVAEDPRGADDGPAGALLGPLVAEHLGAAQEVVVAVCTVGDRLRAYAAEELQSDPVHGFALEGLASAAAETLSEAMCRRIEDDAAAAGLQASMPLNPGMIGWPTREGQQQIFALVDAQAIGVTLRESGIMEPLKTVSFAVGLGPEMGRAGRSCDYCALRDLCRYQHRPDAH